MFELNCLGNPARFYQEIIVICPPSDFLSPFSGFQPPVAVLLCCPAASIQVRLHRDFSALRTRCGFMSWRGHIFHVNLAVDEQGSAGHLSLRKCVLAKAWPTWMRRCTPCCNRIPKKTCVMQQKS